MATLCEDMIAPSCLTRVERGQVGWCGPEVLRVEGEHLLRAEGDDGAFAAEAIFLRALEMARSHQALAWELRVVCSLTRLWAGSGSAADGAALLRLTLARFTQGWQSADLRAARDLLTRMRV